MVLVCFSLMISDVEILFMYLFAICESSLEKHLYRFFGHFFNWVVFLLLKVKVVQSDSFQPPGRYSPWNSPGQNAEVSSRSLLQGIFPNKGSNPGLPYCRPIPYQLSH